ncbi:hypothetical protein LTR94_025116 [Friedmanniomyces endolithicus]|nr:hypothetical protein LTR94_025116 [Friedmanniomyces endolithicus]
MDGSGQWSDQGPGYVLIDAHQHVWRLAAPWHEWPTAAEGLIYRDFDLKQAREPSDQDTDWLVSLAADDDSVIGVVGWVDFKRPDAVDRIVDLARYPKLVGLRPMLQSLPVGWILDPAAEPAIAAMIERGLRFDALVTPAHLSDIEVLAKRWPDLAIIIDHCGKPNLSGQGFDAWREAMAALARHPCVWCKLSGLLTEGAPEQVGEVERIAQVVLGLFGANRLVWGSDWPVITLRASYLDWLEQSRDLVRRLAPQHEAGIFATNAQIFYGLLDPRKG